MTLEDYRQQVYDYLTTTSWKRNIPVGSGDSNDVQLLKLPDESCQKRRNCKIYNRYGMHVYVGKFKSDDFDHEIAKAKCGDLSGYFSDYITPHLTSRKLYGQIMNHNDVVQTDWGAGM